MMKIMFINYGLIFLSALADSFAAYAIKSQFNKLGVIEMKTFGGVISYLFTMLKSPILVFAIIAYAAAPALWFFALNRIELTIAYPLVVAFHMFFIVIFGVYLLDEAFTWNKIVSVALVTAAVLVLYVDTNIFRS